MVHSEPKRSVRLLMLNFKSGAKVLISGETDKFHFSFFIKNVIFIGYLIFLKVKLANVSTK